LDKWPKNIVRILKKKPKVVLKKIKLPKRISELIDYFLGSPIRVRKPKNEIEREVVELKDKIKSQTRIKSPKVPTVGQFYNYVY